jgi:shikimate dehydrogenase
LAAALKGARKGTEISAGASRAAALWVNATPLGMEGFPDESPASAGKCSFAFDLVYGRETAFLREAKKSGARTQGGLSMLAHQALRGWEFWFSPLGAKREKLAGKILKELK